MQSSKSASEINQQPPKTFAIQDILIRAITGALESAYAKYITFVTFIYLTIQFYAILTGDKIIGLPDPWKLPTIIFAVIIIIFYIYHKARKLFKQSQSVYEQLARPKTSKYINENLTYRDVEFAICCLFKRIDQSRFLIPSSNPEKPYDQNKNIIVGIDRGGAIVGGALAKMLVLPIATLSVNYPLPSNNEAKSSELGDLKYIDFSLVKKILLVDDVLRTGQTMTKAKAKLDDIKKYYHEIGYDIDYRTVAILYEEHYGIHSQHKPPDFLVYYTKHSDIQMPWDTINSKDLLKRYENDLRTFLSA